MCNLQGFGAERKPEPKNNKKIDNGTKTKRYLVFRSGMKPKKKCLAVFGMS